MLKWTVISRRDPDSNAVDSRHLHPDRAVTPTPRSKVKRRRSSTSVIRRCSTSAARRNSIASTSNNHRRRSSASRRNSMDMLEDDKENQYTSTPIKSSAENNFLSFEALRDVSNLTPTMKEMNREQFTDGRRILSAKKCKSEKKIRTPFTSQRYHHKKKKDCISSHNDFLTSDSQCSNYFRPFETVDSHIGALPTDDLCACKKAVLSCVKKRVHDTYAPTLPTYTTEYSPCQLKTTHCLATLNRNSTKKIQPIAKLLEGDNLPPSKKPKTDHVNDFLHQITFITSPERNESCFPGLRTNTSTKKVISSDKVTPLVKRFFDFRFSKGNSTIKVNNNLDNSSFINNMSLDKIVDAILDTTDDSIRPTVKRALNSSLCVNLESENENQLNESREQNVINLANEQRKMLESVSANSSDSGFRSSNNDNFRLMDRNFNCKCNNNNKENNDETGLCKDETFIQLNETYNERCVDEVDSKKRRFSQENSNRGTEKKKPHLDNSLNSSQCTLRRQRCVRRRKPLSSEKQISLFPTDSLNRLDFESTPIRNCYLETKEIPGSTIVPAVSPVEKDIKTLRRCLFDSPRMNDSLSLSDSTVASKCSLIDVRGSMDLTVNADDKNIYVNVMRCKDLYRPNGDKINAYVKIALGDRLGDNRKNKNAVLQRTAVQGDSTRPQFNHLFKFPVVNEDSHKVIYIEVWHRDRTSRTSEFLGCMSFDVRNVIKEQICGSYKLLPQSAGRTTNVPITPDQRFKCPDPNNYDARKPTKMCESQSSVEEVISLDDLDAALKKSSNKAVLIEQQKYADENLFLRYLELDPTEGPDATSAATQRKATGNRNGRTPFTCTKKLTKQPKAGFGFSVVWTHPPRVERVEKGLPADKAGILPGDYIIFVDKHNVVMMPEIDILNLIRSYGSQLTLEIFRRNPSRNGSVPSVKRLSAPLATSATLGGSSVLQITSVTSSSNLVQRRPSTVCSTNTISVDYSRRKLQLPQVTFSSEVGNGVIV